MGTHYLFPLLLGLSCHGIAAPLDKAAVEKQSAALIAQYFPRLKSQKVVVKEFSDDFDYFRASVGNALASASKRTYILKVNKKVYADPPSEPALRGILMHELFHLDGYARMSSSQLVRLGAHYAVAQDGAWVYAYEHRIDEQTLKAGFGPQLKDFRIWLYNHLSPADAAKKRREYYTPEQIDAWLSAHH